MWSDMTFWWLAMGAIVILELLTGTIYLLMVALGFGAGGLAAWLGAPLSLQLVAAAVVALVSVALCHRYKRQRQGSTALHAGADRDVVLDVGELVQVNGWQQDFTTQVHYRGAAWSALLVPSLQTVGSFPAPGLYRVVELVGNRLVVAPAAATTPPRAEGAASMYSESHP